jgi:hypothetical protein
MRRVPIYFILTLCVLVSCERKNPAARATAPSPSPASPAPIQSIAARSAQPSQTPTGDFLQVAQSIRPAVIIVSVFDETGHLSANGSDFRVSPKQSFQRTRAIADLEPRETEFKSGGIPKLEFGNEKAVPD